MSLLFTIVLAAFFGISSFWMNYIFVKKKMNEDLSLNLKKNPFISTLGSLFISIPTCILVSIIAYWTQSRFLSGLGIMTFGLSGLALMIYVHIKGNLLKEKYNNQFLGAFVLYIIISLIGLSFTLEIL